MRIPVHDRDFDIKENMFGTPWGVAGGGSSDVHDVETRVPGFQ